jgi:hydrogenase maturation protease
LEIPVGMIMNTEINRETCNKENFKDLADYVNRPCPILVLGIGNVLLKDEGIGAHVAQRLPSLSLPENVEVIDGGTMGLELLYLMENRDKVILIDAIQTTEPPGTIFRFQAREIPGIIKENKLSFHQLGIYDTFKVSQYLGRQLPEIIVIAVQPKDISMGTELSPEIEAKIPEIFNRILEEI